MKGPPGSNHRGGEALYLKPKSECDGHAILAALVPVLAARLPKWTAKKLDTYAITILRRARKAMDHDTTLKRSKRSEVSWHLQVIRASVDLVDERTPGLGVEPRSSCVRQMLNTAIESLEIVAKANTGPTYYRPACWPYNNQ